MLLTLKDVLGIDILKDSKVLTAKEYLDKKNVDSISVIEIPVDNFVRKNEFVLSTAIGCSDDPQLFREFVHDVIRSEAAALAIAKGHYVQHIPEEVLQLAQSEKFPIIEIPWELRFSDIIHQVLSEINHWQRVAVKQSEDLQRELLHLFLQKVDLSGAAEVIRLKIGAPVVILDKEGDLRGKSKNAKKLVSLVHDRPISTYYWKSLRNEQQIRSSHVKWTTLKDEQIMLHMMIRSANVVQGYLLVLLPNQSSLKQFLANDQELLLEHAATSAALWFQRENTIRETEMKLRDDFVWSLAKDEVESWDILTSRAALLGFDLELPYICLIGLPENLEHIYQLHQTKQAPYEYWLQDFVRQVEEKIISCGKQQNRKVMTTFQQGKFIIYLQASDDEASTIAQRYLDQLEDKVKQTYPTLVISWGMSEHYLGQHCFHQGFQDASLALEVGMRQKGSGKRHTYASTGVYRILQILANDTEVHAVVASTIGDIVEYDQEKGLELIHTLMIYIRNSCNVSQTARELNLHRQSLLYRLNRIESLTGLSLNDPDNLFLLDLSLRLWSTGQINSLAKD